MMEITSLVASARRMRYVPVLPGFEALEVPHGLAVETPWVVTYLGLHMRHPSWPLWTVFYTEWCAHVAAALVWDCYDNCRLFWIPPALRAHLRNIDLSQVLGGPANYQELLRLVRFIDQKNWDLVDPTLGNKGPDGDLSPTCRGEGGTFMWFDPWKGTEVTRNHAAQVRKNRPTMPRGHPVGLVFLSHPGDGQVPQVAAIDPPRAAVNPPSAANLPEDVDMSDPEDPPAVARTPVETGYGISANPYDTDIAARALPTHGKPLRSQPVPTAEAYV